MVDQYSNLKSTGGVSSSLHGLIQPQHESTTTTVWKAGNRDGDILGLFPATPKTRSKLPPKVRGGEDLQLQHIGPNRRIRHFPASLHLCYWSRKILVQRWLGLAVSDLPLEGI